MRRSIFDDAALIRDRVRRVHQKPADQSVRCENESDPVSAPQRFTLQRARDDANLQWFEKCGLARDQARHNREKAAALCLERQDKWSNLGAERPRGRGGRTLSGRARAVIIGPRHA